MISGEVVGEGGLRVDTTSWPDKFVETVLSPAVYGTNLCGELLSLVSSVLKLAEQPTCTGLMGLSKPVHSKSKKTILGLLDLFLPWLPIIIEGFYYFQNYESEIETLSNKTVVTLA